jgi:hypothetical protein
MNSVMEALCAGSGERAVPMVSIVASKRSILFKLFCQLALPHFGDQWNNAV